MYGQMTAGSWIYIGTQGILQGTYETFAAVAAKRFGGTLAGTLTLTGGAGGMGGAQPLAVTMNDGVCLCVDVDPTRLQRRVDHRYLDEWTDDLDEALRRVLARQEGASRVECRPARQRGDDLRGAPAPWRGGGHRDRPDVGARPAAATCPKASTWATGTTTPKEARGVHRRARASRWPSRSRRWWVSWTQGAEVFDYGNSHPRRSPVGWLRARLRLPRLRAGLHPPALLRGQGPVSLGGALG